MDAVYDYVVIGSGTSAGVWVNKLTRAGFSVLMVEAGRDLSAQFPLDEMDYNSQMFWNGGMDLSKDAGFVFLRARVLGGGSVINQCLLDRFDDVALDDWRQRTGHDLFRKEGMAPHYDLVEGRINLQEIPRELWNRNAEIFVEGFEKLGFGWAPLHRGYSNCATEEGNDCMACLGGCPRNSKQSVLVAFLPDAREHGLVTETGVEVHSIREDVDYIEVRGWKHGSEVKFRGRKCVLAAGSLGTTKILLASGYRNSLPQLGKTFFCHPQLMTFAHYDEEVNSHKGMFQSVKSDDPGMRAAGYKLENVFAPPIATALLYKTFGRRHADFMKGYNHLACIEVAVRDATSGRITLDKKGRLVIEKRMGKEDWRRAKAGLESVRRVFEVTGGREIYSSPFTFGLHLMGGCSIGEDKVSSVVGHDFSLHGNDRVLVSDSSVFPSAPGINPALTIMAMSNAAASLQVGGD